MNGLRTLWLATLALMPGTVAAQTQVLSPEPQAVAVTLYRDPGRGVGPMDPKWPKGFALVTETRTVTLPAGRFVLRFEGVAEGMMPETAIVTGLPRAVDEKNRDARLLSPASLANAYLKRRVMIRRTNLATGRITSGEAVIEAGPGNGVVLTTAEGVEALGCAGLREALAYPQLPADLSARPTFSVIGDSPASARITVQISYLAQGFDWSADYVATIGADGATIDLFAWMTLANGGSQGFARAQAQAVAGRLNKEQRAVLPAAAPPQLQLRCWPMDVTSTHPRREWERMEWVPEPIETEQDPTEIVAVESVVYAPAMAMDVATPLPAVSFAALEKLGDLKLYRIPERVDIAAMGQKQAALLQRRNVRFDRLHIGAFTGLLGNAGFAGGETQIALRADNREDAGLGLPLPQGRVAIFEDQNGRRLLVGEARLDDRAIGDEVEFGFGTSANVRYRVTSRMPVNQGRFHVEATNANAAPALFELMLPPGTVAEGAVLVERRGQLAWRVTVPANGAAGLDFTMAKRR